MLDHLLRFLSLSSRHRLVTRRRTLTFLSDAAGRLLALGFAGVLANLLGGGVRPLLARPTGEESKSRSSHVPVSGGDQVDPYRLPSQVIPTRYDLRLEPDFTAFTFIGTETVTVTVREPVSEILLNAAELTISDAAIENDAGETHRATVELVEADERYRFTFSARLKPGPWRLRLSFKGILNDKLRGFYRSTYKDQSGKTQDLAATQFEATDARRAFPCWDEPAFKAVFAVTLAIDPALTAVSNTAVSSERIEGGKKILQFGDTIRMSTYLVAFVIGALEATDPVLVGKTPLRVWSVPGKRKLGAFGRDIGAFSLKFFEDYYGLPYPGGKLDLLAIPDFASGAMENLGAITFRENALLVDERAATHAELERIADVVAHENAHMWFGDLVTMSWWNGLWLNEAFATFMEMLAVDAWKPEWQRWTTFGASRAAALTVDGLHSTRPIEYPVLAPRDADAMFDVLTYEKGASVLRMLEQHLGAESFRAGVHEYLKAHAYDNADTGDLWKALGRSAKEPVPELMDGWIFQPGYPLISVKLDQKGGLLFRQERFAYLPLEKLPPSLQNLDTAKKADQRWHVPIQIRIVAQGKSSTRRLLLTETETRVEMPKGFESILVNESGHGFYRVHYQAELLERLLRAPDHLAAIERFNLVNDTWAAVVAGLIPLTSYLELTAKFRAERDRNVWAVLIESFHALHRLIEPADRPSLEALIRDRLRSAIDQLGWAPQGGEDELKRQLRGDLLRAFGTIGNDREAQARAAKLYDGSVKGKTGQESSIDPNVLPALIAMLAHSGDAQRYEEFLQHFRTAATPQEEKRYLYALAAFQPPALLEQTLARTINGEFRTQDAPFLVRMVLMSVYGRDLAWRFVKTNWDVMDRQFPKQGLRRMCEGFIGLATPQLEQDVHRFVADRKIDLGGKTLAQYLEQLRIAVTLRERERIGLAKHLKTFS